MWNPARRHPMRNVAMSLLWSLWVTMAGAGDVPEPKAAAQVVQERTNAPTSGIPRKGWKATEKTLNEVSKASKKPSVPLRLLDEKNLGLGCAQPS